MLSFYQWETKAERGWYTPAHVVVSGRFSVPLNHVSLSQKSRHKYTEQLIAFNLTNFYWMYLQGSILDALGD